MGKRLYVGNLSYNVTNSSLEELFAPFGKVNSAEVVQDRDTGAARASVLSKWPMIMPPNRRSAVCMKRNTTAVR